MVKRLLSLVLCTCMLFFPSLTVMASMDAVVEKDDIISSITLKFEDVESSDWFYDSVFSVMKKGYMTGMSETKFGPYEGLSRAQFAVILWRMEGSKKEIFRSLYSDIEEGEWYTDAIMWCSKTGVVTGYSNGKFGPSHFLTREQMATMLYRYASYRDDFGLRTDHYEGTSLKAYADYKDVSSFASTPLKWATCTGIIAGKSDGKLDPQGLLTRAEASIIIDRYIQAKNKYN